MKKKLVAMMMTMALTAAALAGCGAPPPEEAPAAPETSEEAAPAEEAAPEEEGSGAAESAANPADYRVALMIPGNLGDKSFFDASFESIELIKSELGVTMDYVEVGTDTTKYYPTFVDLCEQDYDLILTISSNCDDALLEVALEYPDQKFINLDDELTDLPDNVYIMATRNNEMSYLAGVVAALKAEELEESTIGFVGGMDIPGINEFLVGYIDGAQSVNPDIKVSTSYVGSFTDSAKGKENALLLYNSGISIVFAAAGQSGLGVIDAAAQLGKFAIGVDSDQAEALKESNPEMAEAIITSAIKLIPHNALDAVKRAMENNVNYGTREVFGLADGAVGIAENEYYEKLLSEEQKARVEEVKQNVISGAITIKETAGLTTDEVSEIRESVRP